MGITQYQRAKKMLLMLKQEKGEVVKFDEFVFAMKIHISGDIHRVQKPYFELMKDLKMIKEDKNGVRILLSEKD